MKRAVGEIWRGSTTFPSILDQGNAKFAEAAGAVRAMSRVSAQKTSGRICSNGERARKIDND